MSTTEALVAEIFTKIDDLIGFIDAHDDKQNEQIDDSTETHPNRNTVSQPHMHYSQEEKVEQTHTLGNDAILSPKNRSRVNHKSCIDSSELCLKDSTVKEVCKGLMWFFDLCNDVLFDHAYDNKQNIELNNLLELNLPRSESISSDTSITMIETQTQTQLPLGLESSMISLIDTIPFPIIIIINSFLNGSCITLSGQTEDKYDAKMFNNGIDLLFKITNNIAQIEKTWIESDLPCFTQNDFEELSDEIVQVIDIDQDCDDDTINVSNMKIGAIWVPIKCLIPFTFSNINSQMYSNCNINSSLKTLYSKSMAQMHIKDGVHDKDYQEPNSNNRFYPIYCG